MQFGPIIPPNVTAPHLGVPGLLIDAALFAAIAIATSRRPVFGILALILLDPFAFYQSVGIATLTLSKIALLAVISGLLWRKTSLRAMKAWPVRTLVAAVALVAAATALSVWHASAIVPALRETLKWSEYAAILAVSAVAFYDDPDETLIRWAFLIATAIVVALAIPEIFVGATSGIIFAHTEVPRIAGPLEGPNQLAAYLGLALPVLLAYTLREGRRWPEIFVIAGGVLATLLSFSRGGIVALAFALCLVAMLCVQSKLARGAFAGAALAVLLAAAAGWRIVAGGIGLVTAHVHHIDIRGGLGTRRDLWEAALSLWRAHPFWGIGAGNYELEVGKLLHAPIKTHTNSFYLQSLVEGGIPLLAATLFLIYTSMATFIGRARTPLAIAALAASAALSLHHILDLLVFYPKVGIEWMILLGLAAANLARRGDQSAIPS